MLKMEPQPLLITVISRAIKQMVLKTMFRMKLVVNHLILFPIVFLKEAGPLILKWMLLLKQSI